MTLSIVVITMNRAEQLCSALSSCINSKLPDKTEFVIVDNASTDNTEDAVKEFFAAHPYPFVYEKEPINKGVGGGRNRGFELAKGEIVYFLDDDAVVAPESYDTFFKVPMSAFHNDPLIASITTRIYDELLECDRAVIFSKSNSVSSLPEIFMYLGGSHFLRKLYFDKPLYLDFKYGMEELIPSIFVIDKGMKNCYFNQIKVLHQPCKNKWISGTNEMNGIIAEYNVNNYFSKWMVYPSLFKPILFFMFIIRTARCFKLDRMMWLESFRKLQTRKKNIKGRRNKVKIKTVLSIIRNYSIGTAF